MHGVNEYIALRVLHFPCRAATNRSSSSTLIAFLFILRYSAFYQPVLRSPLTQTSKLDTAAVDVRPPNFRFRAVDPERLLGIGSKHLYNFFFP